MQRFLTSCLLMRTSKRLAIYCNHSWYQRADPLHPLNKARFKLFRIDEGKDTSKGVMRGYPVGQLHQFGEPRFLRLPQFFDLYPSLCSTEDPTNRQNDDIA